jgi:predicted nucleic acid-binding protein
MAGRQSAIGRAEFYRFLRSRGMSVRRTIDVLIAAFCITEDRRLLHCDRDFDAFKHHLGLRVLRP